MGAIIWLEEHPRITRLSTVIYLCIIFVASSMSRLPQPGGGYDFSVLAHFMEYAVLGLLIAVSLGVRKDRIILVILLSSLYGVSDELHQFFVPGRVASIHDVATDFLGSAAGALSALFLRRRL
jgi:VanZ family protein